MSELDLANHDASGGSGEEAGSPRAAAARGGWEGGHALAHPGAQGQAGWGAAWLGVLYRC